MTAKLIKYENEGYVHIFSVSTSCKSKKRPIKTVAHLPDLQLEVERIQAQRSCLPDWPSGKPTLVLPDLTLEQVRAGQRHNIMMTKQMKGEKQRTFRKGGAAGTSTQKHT